MKNFHRAMKFVFCKRRIEMKSERLVGEEEEEEAQHRNYTFICLPSFQHRRSMLIEKEVTVMCC